MKKIFIIAIVAGAFVACKSKSSDSSNKEVTAEKTTVVPVADHAKDSTDIRNTILDFYSWYNGNFMKFQKFNLYSGIHKKDQPPYKLNWDEVKRYHAYVRDSVPQLGTAFANNQDLFFKKIDSALTASPDDDIPPYFDYDWYTNTQEDPAYTLDQLKKAGDWKITINGDQAEVIVRSSNAAGNDNDSIVEHIWMSRENGVWKIAKIGEAD